MCSQEMRIVGKTLADPRLHRVFSQTMEMVYVISWPVELWKAGVPSVEVENL